MKKLFLTLCLFGGLIFNTRAAEISVSSESGTITTVSSGVTNSIAAVSVTGKVRAYLYVTLLSSGCDVLVLNSDSEPLTYLSGKGASLNLETFIRNQRAFLVGTNGTSVNVIVAEGIGSKY